jgi:D-alanine-D-alanine ligase
MRIAVLHDLLPEDARPDEQDTLAQARFVAKELARAGHATDILPFSLDLGAAAAALARLQPDLVFNLVESVGGKARLLHLAPAVLDSLRYRYTGAPTGALFLTTDKVLAKRWLASRGIPTPAWTTGAADEAALPRGRYIVKSVHEEASVGLEDDAVVEADAPALARLIAERAPRLGGEAFAEAFIEGREFNLSMLDGEVLPIAETLFVGYAPEKPRIVGYAAKWRADSYEYHNTPRRFGVERDEPGLARTLSDLARQCWATFGLRGYARVDFRVDERGPWVLEINANPCLSPDAGFMAAAGEAGFKPRDVLERIVRCAG